MTTDLGRLATPPGSSPTGQAPAGLAGSAATIPSAQHTLGPWSTPHFAKPESNCACGYVLTNHLMGAICTVHASGEGANWIEHGDNPKFAEACANARLIAAAPDLLEALEDAVQCIEPDVYPDAYRAARSAIAKAQGRDSDASLAEDAKRLSPEGVAARAEGIAKDMSHD